ncbi:MAG: hypothetical protein ACRDIX_00630 [Actinomycetota bacterium]
MEPVIEEREAVEAAQRELDQREIPYADREAQVRLEDSDYVVVFPPPPDTRAGDFTLRISSADGSILDVRIER